jgi:hypothetical protein
VTLRVALSISEKSAPTQRETTPESGDPEAPDPKGLIPGDDAGLVRVEAAAVPTRVAAGSPVRIHVVLQPARTNTAHWDSEAGPARLWIEAPEGWSPARIAAASLDEAKLEPGSRRRFEIEVQVPPNTPPGPAAFTGYVFYPVCEDEEGQCLFLRQEVAVELEVLPGRPR